MLAKHATVQDLEKALEKTNESFDGNIEFKRLDHQGHNIRFTLTVKQSRGKGGRLGFQRVNGGNQRHIKAACWHVHGEFFDNLLAINPEALVVTRGEKIYKSGDTVRGNWEDSNIGSQWYPLYFSEACECE